METATKVAGFVKRTGDYQRGIVPATVLLSGICRTTIRSLMQMEKQWQFGSRREQLHGDLEELSSAFWQGKDLIQFDISAKRRRFKGVGRKTKKNRKKLHRGTVPVEQKKRGKCMPAAF